jgi:alkaline phosphatase D
MINKTKRGQRMDQSRRRFLGGILVGGLALGVGSQSAMAGGRSGPLRAWWDRRPLEENRWPIVQGPTDESSTTIILQFPKGSIPYIRILDPSNSEMVFLIDGQRDVAEAQMITIFVPSLLPALVYRLQLSDGARLLDERTFSALSLSANRCRFGMVSCMNDRYPDQARSMWRALAREKMDFVLFLGDTVYADFQNPNRDRIGYETRYSATRSLLSWFQQERLTPSFAVWDDHDFGLNDSDENLPAKAITTELFRLFWFGRNNSSWRATGFGVGSRLSVAGQRFYLMDDRSFRSPAGTRGGLHWGREQRDWLLEDLARENTPAWLANGSQFHGAYLGKESYEADHGEDFADFRKRLSLLPCPVAFLSGDVHFSELMEIEQSALGYKTFEFTSSSVHSITFPGHHLRARNPRRLNADWKHNYMCFDSKVESGRWRIECRSVLEGGEESFKRTVAIARG